MYNVSRIIHEKYGYLLSIERIDLGSFQSPYEALYAVIKKCQDWQKDSLKKVRILIDHQVLSLKGAERWANEEYKSLPKCENCPTILHGDIHTHQLSESFFCSKKCADQDYLICLEKIKNEEEIEYL